MKKNNVYLIILVLVIVSFFAFWNFNASSNLNVGEQSMFGSSNNSLTELQKDIVKKFKEGNVPGLVEYLDEEVSITLMKETDFYLKEEAENVLVEFFQNNTTKNFFVKHYGVNQAGTFFYLIAELSTTEKKEYRIYISNNKTHIENIEITKPRDI
ncbi:MAG: DUF4783 domain-containing protein [Saprospiraceae bacterium]